MEEVLRELSLPVEGRRGRSLEGLLRERIRRGVLAPGTRLPSSRDLAGQLGVARGTVTAVYRQLAAEGYLVAVRGSGTRVAELAAPGAGGGAAPGGARARFDLSPGLPSLAAFPRAAWLRAVRAALAEVPDAALGYPEAAGSREFRAELAGYLGRVRSVEASAERIVVTHGTFDALGLLAGHLREEGHGVIAVEDPCGAGQRELLARSGLEVVGVPVDGEGLDVAALAATGARAVVVTAAHHYPLGVALSAARRRALVAWARERDGLIVEDDYDAEYRYDRPALAAVQGMAPEHVVYSGTVSKTLAPALRLGWLVVPVARHADLARRMWLRCRGAGGLDQAAFTRFLSGGGYDRHLRVTRAEYRRRRDAFLAALAELFPQAVPEGIDAGLHVLLRLPEGSDDAAVARRAQGCGVAVTALSSYAPGHRPALVAGFAGVPVGRMRAAVSALATAYVH
ncbi:GntR family transcriptional regulator [Actinorhabdospora filicis]|uniref:GntR family transcriptional regulator n=1 Tax=Actinorhabdospora filicis TaxID=1785913 RepID=A0A9W6SQG0_9ACTN|nr:PLP-dependent aminotransferase family protein [Actinorhabdospora filicis]GLZ78866.1 GntR family transcriptional regulator [Actinorhabdospora filicis]